MILMPTPTELLPILLDQTAMMGRMAEKMPQSTKSHGYRGRLPEYGDVISYRKSFRNKVVKDAYGRSTRSRAFECFNQVY